MEQLPVFDEAALELQRFLRAQGHSDDIAWAFREDWCSSGPSCHRVVWPLSADNEQLARALYLAGCGRGLVELKAVFSVEDRSVATVIAPQPDEVQGWSRGLKLAIHEPFVHAAPIKPGFAWRLHRLTPAYRRFQRHETSIPRRALLKVKR